MFTFKNLNIEAKRGKLTLNCESSEANIVISKNQISEAKKTGLFLKNDNIEAKRTGSIVRKFILKRSEHVYIKEFKYRSEANTYVSSKIYFEAKRTCL
jgi:hypothetical protein